MADIEVEIDYEGTETGAAQLDRLTEGLGEVSEAQARAAGSATAANTAMIAQRQGLEQLGSTIGQVGATLARVNPAFGRLGATIGAVGAQIPALTGSLGPMAQAMAAATIAVDLGTQAWEFYSGRAQEDIDAANARAGAIRNLAGTFDELLGAIQRVDAAQDVQARLARGIGTEQEFEARAQVFENRAAQIRLQLQGEIAGDTLRQRLDTVRSLTARMNSAMRQAATVREQLERGQREGFITEQEATGAGAGFGAVLPEPEARAGGRGAAASAAAEERESAARLAAKEAREAESAAIEAEGQALLDALDAQEDAARQQGLQDEIEYAASIEQINADSHDRRTAMALEAIEKEKQARDAALADRRAENAEIAASLTQITTAVLGAFDAAIEGEKSLEEALVETTKQLLKQFGIELVAKGIGKILEGIAEIPSPTAATKIAGGAGMVAFGVGLGAVGAAIPSAPSGAGAEAPREDTPRGGDGGGPTTLVLNVNNPQMAAQTQAQLARSLGRSLRADRTFPASAGQRR